MRTETGSATGSGVESSLIERIRTHIAAHWGADVRIVGRAPGHSHDGWIMTCADRPGQRFLVRTEPRDGPFLTYDAIREAELLGGLARLGLPVPHVLMVGGPEICGVRFLVLDWIDGVVHTPHSAARLGGAERIAYATEFVQTLTRLHRLPWTDLLDRGQDPSVSGLLRQFGRTLDQLVVVSSVVLDYVRVWLQQAAVAHSGEVALVHGDFRLGNLVWRDARIVGILDWETARVGDPLFDLAWSCMGATSGESPVMGLVSRDEFVALYARAAGRDVAVRDLIFWQVAAAWVRGCTEARLLDLSVTPDRPETDARDLSWEFGLYRTEHELLSLIDQYEQGR
jgi:aminoglycoside phosphotransferase (APT) family kinase protein